MKKAGIGAGDVEWVSLGPSPNTRAALISHRVDAALLTAPTYFNIPIEGMKVLVDFAKDKDILASRIDGF